MESRDSRNRLRSLIRMRRVKVPRVSKRQSLIALGVVFACAVVGMVFLFSSFPSLSEEEKTALFRLPRTSADIRAMYGVLSVYTKTYYLTVVVGFLCCYILYVAHPPPLRGCGDWSDDSSNDGTEREFSLQAFSIPGSAMFSVLGGALFGFRIGFILVSIASCVGATTCFMLSKKVAVGLAARLWPSKIRWLRAQVVQRRRSLLSYMLFLRVTPLVPNVVINWASPVLGVPTWIFVVATFFGVMPNTALLCRAGTSIAALSDAGTVLSAQTLFLLLALGGAVLLPALFQRAGTDGTGGASTTAATTAASAAAAAATGSNEPPAAAATSAPLAADRSARPPADAAAAPLAVPPGRLPRTSARPGARTRSRSAGSTADRRQSVGRRPSQQRPGAAPAKRSVSRARSGVAAAAVVGR